MLVSTFVSMYVCVCVCGERERVRQREGGRNTTFCTFFKAFCEDQAKFSAIKKKATLLLTNWLNQTTTCIYFKNAFHLC